MLLLSWVLLGFLAGIIVSLIPRRGSAGAIPDVSVGMSGAVVGGWLFGAWAPHGLSDGVLLGSVLPAGVGAVVFLAVHLAIGRRFGRAQA